MSGVFMSSQRYMGSPQIEDGYTKLANELLDAVISFNFSSRQYKVIMAIIRKTYGYNKTNDDISLTQIEKMCSMPKSHVSTTIKDLVDMNVLDKQKGVYGFNLSVKKDYSEWVLLGAKKSKQERKIDLSLHNHYVYMVKNTEGQFYIGVRSCLCHPFQDKYLGSGNWVATQVKSNLTKEVLTIHKDRKEAEIQESKIIIENKDNEKNMNIAIYKKNNGILHKQKPVTETVTSYINDNERVTEKVINGLQEQYPQKTITKDNYKRKQNKISLREYIDICKAENKKVIAENDTVFEFIEKSKIPIEYLRLAWLSFRDEFVNDNNKKQASWAQTFRNYVIKDYLKVWAFNRDGECYLTTKGKQLENYYRENNDG